MPGPTISAKIREAVERLRARQSVLPDGQIKVRRAPPPPPPPPESAQETSYRMALAEIADRQFCQSVKYGEQQWRADRVKAHQRILEFERLLVKRLRRVDVPVFAPTIWRNEADQNAAYVLGHSKAKWGESPHNYGCAVDIIHGIRGWDLSRRQWDIIGHIGKELAIQNALRITWGGDWKTIWDPAHWELTDWHDCKIIR